MKENFAPWLRTELIYHSDTSEKPTRYVFAEDRASLLYLANLACIDHNPWMSRMDTLDHPDFMLIDLDPQQCSYDKIVEAALLVRKKLDALELEGIRRRPAATACMFMCRWSRSTPMKRCGSSRRCWRCW